jgi:hypothetical protein
MLIKVFDLLQHEDLLDLYTRYPSIKEWFNEPLRQSVEQQADFLGGSEGPGDEGELSVGAFDKALRHALVSARKRNGPEFARLAGETFGPRLCPIDQFPGQSQMNIFVQGALYDVYSWNPEPWKIPDYDELAKLEALICLPGDTDTELPITDKGIFYFPGMDTHMIAANERWFFSAASIAIDCCKSNSSRFHHLNAFRRIFTNVCSTADVTRAKVQLAQPRTARRFQGGISA